MKPETTEGVIALFKHILPALSTQYLRGLVDSPAVETIILLVPEGRTAGDSASEEDDDSEENHDSASEEDEEVINAAEESGDAEDSESASKPDDAVGSDNGDEGDGGDDPGRSAMRRRLAGAVSFKYSEVLGRRLLQVSLLGVRMRYQRLGIGSRLLQTLLGGKPCCDDEGDRQSELASSISSVDVALAWADRRALAFFRRHGFSDEPLLT